MNIDITWDNPEQTVLRYIFKPRWSWTDLQNVMKEASVMMDTVEHPVDIIMDVTAASLIPSGAIAQAQKAFTTPKHSRAGITIVVSTSSFAQALVAVGRKLSGRAAQNWEMEFVTSLEHARELLKRNYPAEGKRV